MQPQPNEPLPNPAPKVFCVGFNKTGTTSVAFALRELGFLPSASPKTLDDRPFHAAVFNGDFDPLVEAARPFRSFKDRPWNMGGAFAALDAAFPGSRFILTVREEEAWWQSVHRWVTLQKPFMLTLYMAHLGALQFTREAFLAGYRNHNDRIRAHFSGRADLLEMDLQAGDGWPQLCGFLGLTAPDRPFHHVNGQDYSLVPAPSAGPRVHRVSHSGI